MKTRNFWAVVVLIALTATSAFLLFLAPPWTWKDRWRVYQRAQRDIAPIAFYGKVIDQNGAPVSGVTFLFSLHSSKPNLLSSKDPTLLKKFEVWSDDKGMVSVTGLSGQSLSLIGITKEGYRSELTGGRLFAYTPSYDAQYRYVPDPANPVVIHMWKKGPTEPLIERKRGFGVHLDGSPITVDLLTGKSEEGCAKKGDLILSMKRPEGLLYPRTPYDWEFEIQAVDGGIVETTDVFPYRAPEAGYQPGYNYSLRTNMTIPGGASALKKYYLRGRGGTIYASLELEANSAADNHGEPGGAFYIHYLVSPRGSRNLEPGGKKLNP